MKFFGKPGDLDKMRSLWAMIDRAVNYSDMLIRNGRLDPAVRAALQHDLEDHFNELIETDQTQEDISEIQRILIQLELDGQKLT